MFLKKYNTLSNPYKNILTGLLLFFVYFAATFVKAPILFLKPRFWAEEGVVYFLQGRVIGLLETVTAMPLGYLSFPANIAGWVSAQLPLYHAPLGGLAVSLAIQLLIPCVVIVNRYFDGNRVKQAVFLLVPLLVFQSFETWLNSINSQFWMILAASLILAAPRVTVGLPGTIVNLGVALLAGLSSPGSAFLAPLFVVRAVVERQVKWLFFALAASVGAVIVLALQQSSRGVSFPVDVFGVFASFHLVLNNICMPCANIVHSSVAHNSALRLVLAGFVGFIYIFFWVRADRPGRWLLSASMALAILSFATMLGKEMVLDDSPYFGARYFFAPAALFFGALLASAFQGRRPEILAVILFALNGVFSSVFYPPVGVHFGETWRQSVKALHAHESEVVYFARDLCAFSPSANQAVKNLVLKRLTAESLDLGVASSKSEGEKLFFYRQSTRTYKWEVGAPEWRHTSIFLAGTERFGHCYGGDIPVHDKNLQIHDGTLSINRSLLGPLEGYRFLIGFGDEFAAMLAKNDYLIIDGAELLKAQE